MIKLFSVKVSIPNSALEEVTRRHFAISGA
jgi:hypothetical protein